jgi:hypothetical protein
VHGWVRYGENNVLLVSKGGEIDFCKCQRATGPVGTGKDSNSSCKRGLSGGSLNVAMQWGIGLCMRDAHWS